MKIGKSLQLRLLTGTLAVVAVFWMALSLVAWNEALVETARLLDENLADTGQLLAALAGHEAHEMEAHLPNPPETPDVAFQIWEGGTHLSLQSARAPATRLSPVENGFSDSGDWRVYSLWDNGEQNLVQIAELQTSRFEMSRRLAIRLLVPIAVALPLLCIALVLLVRSTLAPLSSLARSIGSRSPEFLEQIPLDDAPSEMRPILEQLNLLLRRVGASLAHERRFTADAAHELRTPLAAVRTHAQVAQASHETGERETALDNVITATDRAAHLIEQLLTLARLDASTLPDIYRPCDLRALAADVLALEAALAFAKSIDIELVAGQAVGIESEPTLFAVLLRNLIDNAIRYTQPGGKVKVTLRCALGVATIEVADNGPGIPAGERSRVCNRFVRLVGTGTTGAGLGLSIVSRAVELLGATLELADNPDGRGLCVRVSLPCSLPTSLAQPAEP
jgi:two-component system sensor histidine kinase QseC